MRSHKYNQEYKKQMIASFNQVQEREKFLEYHSEFSTFLSLPLGFCEQLRVNGKDYCLPMATEEFSVIAAVNFASAILSKAGGLEAHSSPSYMQGQVILEKAELLLIQKEEKNLYTYLAPHLLSMQQRGGGLIKIEYHLIPQTALLEILFTLDVCDAQGARFVSRIMEVVKTFFQEREYSVLMAILSNEGTLRTARSQFTLPFRYLRKPGWKPKDVAQRIVRASELAQYSPRRAITHNKGIMNAISALALVTWNDTRALEAAIHVYACREGVARGLSQYYIQDDALCAQCELPLVWGIKGVCMDYFSSNQKLFQLLDIQNLSQWSSVGVSLGLAQNLAAMIALVTEGISKGHNIYHKSKSKG